MMTPSHQSSGKKLVIIFLIVCHLSHSCRHVIVSVVFCCRIASEPPVILNQAKMILTDLLAVIITIAVLKEILLSSLCQEKDDQIICHLHISFKVTESKGVNISVRETRHSSYTTLFCGVEGYGQTGAPFLTRSGCVSL